MTQPYLPEYTLIAHAQNGNVITQTPDDKSLLSPTGSAYTDIMANLPLKTLTLVGKGHMFVVDFADGSIAIDGNKCYPPHKPSEGTNVRPVYYRTVIQVSGTDGSSTMTKPRYFVGWEAKNHRGRNYEFKLGVD